MDYSADGLISVDDWYAWVIDVRETWIGDANLDGRFDTTDLVSVFRAGEFEDGRKENSTWETGDWNLDGEFDSADFVIAFSDGGFERGLRRQVVQVPEPASVALSVFAFFVILMGRRWFDG